MGFPEEFEEFVVSNYYLLIFIIFMSMNLCFIESSHNIPLFISWLCHFLHFLNCCSWSLDDEFIPYFWFFVWLSMIVVSNHGISLLFGFLVKCLRGILISSLIYCQWLSLCSLIWAFLLKDLLQNLMFSDLSLLMSKFLLHTTSLGAGR